MKAEKGITFIEVMIVVLILGIIAIPTTRFFKKQMVATQWEQKRQDFRSEYNLFMQQLKKELKLAVKKSGVPFVLYDVVHPLIIDVSSIHFRYEHHMGGSDVFVGYIYRAADHGIWREQYTDDTFSTVIARNVVLRGIQPFHPAEPAGTPQVPVFVDEGDFELITVTVAPFGRRPLLNGDPNEVQSIKIAPRN